MANPIQRLKDFYHETVQEVNKCTWPSKDELMESTVLVIVTVILLTAFISVVDMISQHVVRFLVLS